MRGASWSVTEGSDTSPITPDRSLCDGQQNLVLKTQRDREHASPSHFVLKGTEDFAGRLCLQYPAANSRPHGRNTGFDPGPNIQESVSVSDTRTYGCEGGRPPRRVMNRVTMAADNTLGISDMVLTKLYLLPYPGSTEPGLKSVQGLAEISRTLRESPHPYTQQQHVTQCIYEATIQ